MQKVVVLGGGLAGLSSAVFLSENNIPVSLIESAPRLGGRVFSFYDPLFDAVIDNGQHIMMGCYSSTLQYLKTINALENFYFQKQLEVLFYRSGKLYPLRSDRKLYPFNLLSGLTSFNLLSPKERFSLIKFFALLPISSGRDAENLNAEEWLIRNNQGDNVRKCFWNIFIIGALNTIPSKASASVLRDILFRVFLSGSNSSSIILPIKPLTESFCTPAAVYLKEKGSEVTCSERVLRLEFDYRKNKINRIITSKRTISGFSHVISGIPLFALKKLIPGLLPDFDPVYSPILNIHFKTRMELFPGRFIALVDSPLHWIFKHPDHYTIVISSADDHLFKTTDEITLMIKRELVSQFHIKETDVSAVKIIKERKATFVPSADILRKRPGNKTEYKNLLIAGDWTNTGLPATIEGAIESGKQALSGVYD